MDDRIIRYGKRPDKLEAYKPEKRIKVSKEQTVPVIVRIGNCFAVLGGAVSFFATSFLMAFKGIFGIKKKVQDFSFNKKVVDLRGKSKAK